MAESGDLLFFSFFLLFLKSEKVGKISGNKHGKILLVGNRKRTIIGVDKKFKLNGGFLNEKTNCTGNDLHTSS